jgi:hypothetical protein
MIDNPPTDGEDLGEFRAEVQKWLADNAPAPCASPLRSWR